MRITLLVTEAEHAELKRKAGMVPLSRWIKSVLLGSFEVANMTFTPTVPLEAGQKIIHRGKEVVVAAAAPVLMSTEMLCEHGMEAYKCKKWGCKFYEIPNGRR